MDPRTVEETVERLDALKPADPIVPVEWEDNEDPNASTALAWAPKTERDLDWCLERAAALRAQLRSIEEQKEAALARIEKRATELAAKVERGVRFFEWHAANYAEKNRAVLCSGKKKSRDLLHGRIGWRTRGGKLRVTDKDALLVWLERQAPEAGLFRLKVEPEMKAIQEHFKKTNQIPPGCEWEMPEDHIYIEPLTDSITVTL